MMSNKVFRGEERYFGTYGIVVDDVLFFVFKTEHVQVPTLWHPPDIEVPLWHPPDIEVPLWHVQSF